MVAINFTVFQDKILSGEKCQTVRAKARAKPGDRLQLYTGMRTKACRKLGEAVCEEVWAISIHGEGFFAPMGRRANGYILGEAASAHSDLGRQRLDAFARADGFTSWEACAVFFRVKYGLPFEGQVIVWRDFQPAEGI